MELETRRILVVDDEKDLAEILRESLQSLGLDIDIALDGFEAIGAIQASNYHAILCDINMPRMSGIQFIAEAKRLGFDIPIVILTGNTDREFVLEALRLGAIDFVEKPPKPEVLAEIMEKAVDIGVRKARIRHQIEHGNLSSQADIAQLHREERMLALMQLKNHADRKR